MKEQVRLFPYLHQYPYDEHQTSEAWEVIFALLEFEPRVSHIQG